MAIRKRKPKPTMQEVRERVFKVISYQMGEAVEDLVKVQDTHIQELPQADSLDHIECIMGIEEAFDIEITDDQCAKLRTIQSIVDYIFEQVGDGQQSFKL